MKHPISWHEQSLANMQGSLDRAEEDIKSRRASANKLAAEIVARAEQIKEAKAKGKYGFDSDKFGKKRG